MAGDYDVEDVAVGLRFYIFGSEGISYSTLLEEFPDYEGREQEDIDEALELLEEKGVVEKDGDDEDPVYRMLEPPKDRDPVDVFEDSPMPGVH